MSLGPKPYSLSTLAERWSCSTEHVRNMIVRGEIEAFRHGRSYRITAAEVARIEGSASVPSEVKEEAKPVAGPPPEMRLGQPNISFEYGWPAAMRRKTAAQYLDMGEAAFVRETIAGRLPSSFMLGGREHWLKAAIDECLERLSGGVHEREPDYRRDHRARHGRT